MAPPSLAGLFHDLEMVEMEPAGEPEPEAEANGHAQLAWEW